MGNKRLSELSEMTYLTPSTDVVHVVDKDEVLEQMDKKTTVQCLLEGSAGTDPLPFSYRDEFFPSSLDTKPVSYTHLTLPTKA